VGVPSTEGANQQSYCLVIDYAPPSPVHSDKPFANSTLHLHFVLALPVVTYLEEKSLLCNLYLSAEVHES
jgi:hypothetical protein